MRVSKAHTVSYSLRQIFSKRARYSLCSPKTHDTSESIKSQDIFRHLSKTRCKSKKDEGSEAIRAPSHTHAAIGMVVSKRKYTKDKHTENPEAPQTERPSNSCLSRTPTRESACSTSSHYKGRRRKVDS
jgi:hypothetical protein